MNAVIDWIFQLLKEQNRTQEDLANYLGISKTVISAWKKMKSKSYYTYLDRIAAFFDTDLAKLNELASQEKAKPARYTVYKHVTPSGKVYIGITEAAVEKRWQYGRGYEYNTHFYNAIKKYGWNNITHEVLFTNLAAEEAKQKEIELINFYHSDDRNKGYNVSPGGTLVSASSKEKIRQSRMKKGLNRLQSNRNRENWSDPEWREKTVQNMRGKTRTDEQKKHYKAGRAKQPPMTEETRQKISKTLSSKTGENAIRKKAVLQIEPITMRVIKKFPTAREAATAVGASINSIATICRTDVNSNRTRASHHFFWCYEEDYNPEDFEIYKGIELTASGKLPRTGDRASGYKREWSALAKQRISKANAIPVMCIETGKIYQSTSLAAKEYGVSRSAINKCARGILRTCAGVHWMYSTNVKE